MTDPWKDDGDLLTELGIALRGGEVDPPIATAARGAYAWHGVDAELAALSYDSLLDDELTARVRFEQGPRVLSFESAGYVIEVGISDRGLSAQLLPPGPGSVEVRTPLGVVSVLQADELGVFTLEQVPVGPLSLRCVTASGAVLVTDWVRLNG